MIIKKDIDMVVRIIEENILPQFKDIIGIFKDEWKDKRKPIFEKIATSILTKLKDKEINELLIDQLLRLEGMLGKYNCQHGGLKCNFQTNCHRLIRAEINKLKAVIEDE